MKTDYKNLTELINSDCLEDDSSLSLIVSVPDMIEIVQEMIETHKWFLNLSYSGEIPFDKASDSWIEYVFSPVYDMCKKLKKDWNNFSNKTKLIIILSIIDVWDFLKKGYSKAERIISTTHAFWYYLYLTEDNKLTRLYYKMRFKFVNF